MYTPITITADNLRYAITANIDAALAELAYKVYARRSTPMQSVLDAGGFKLQLVSCDSTTPSSQALNLSGAQAIIAEAT